MVARKTPRRALVIEAGSTHIKLRGDARGLSEEFHSGQKMTPGRMTRQVRRPVKSRTAAFVQRRAPGWG